MYPRRARDCGSHDGIPHMKQAPGGLGMRFSSALIAEVLPAPFGPTNPTISPVSTRNERLETAAFRPFRLAGYLTVKPFTSIAGALKCLHILSDIFIGRTTTILKHRESALRGSAPAEGFRGWRKDLKQRTTGLNSLPAAQRGSQTHILARGVRQLSQAERGCWWARRCA